MVIMFREIDAEISWRVISWWNVFTTIKDKLKVNPDKTLNAIFFNSTVLPVKLYASETSSVIKKAGPRGVMVIVVGNGHGDTSSNPGLIAFHIALIPLGKVLIQLFSL